MKFDWVDLHLLATLFTKQNTLDLIERISRKMKDRCKLNYKIFNEF